MSLTTYSFCSSVPTVISLYGPATFSLQSMSQSPFTISMQSSSKHEVTSIFASRMPSLLPRFSICEIPILVINAISGSTIRASVSICPKLSIPISRTAASVSGANSNMLSGRPNQLLKFLMFLPVLYFMDAM